MEINMIGFKIELYVAVFGFDDDPKWRSPV
jgi:hypothetical protein